jgi:drug/metabolite transporter (DMT)-like permease
MPALALGLVLVAAFIHALWNFVAKKSGGDIRVALLSNIALCVVWAPVGLWFIRRDVAGFGALQWSLVAASGAIHVVYFVTLLRGYRLGDLSVVYPLARGTGPLLTALVATTFLGEALGLVGWLGVLGIVGGIVIIAGGPALLRALRGGTHSQQEHARLRLGARYGLATGAFIAAYSVVDGYAVKYAHMSPVLVDYLSNVVRLPLTAILICVIRQREALPMREYAKRMWRPALAIGALSPIAYVLVLYAVSMAPLSQVAPVREVSMLFAAFLGGSQLGEHDRRARLVGAGCIAAGVVAIALG